MKPIKVFYHPSYACGGLEHFARLVLTAKTVATQSGCSLRMAPAVALPLLGELHDPDYVASFLSGEGSLASSSYLPWSAALRDGVLRMLGGQLAAANAALAENVAANLALGFHHAFPSRGGGFCTFNGLALVALAHPTLKIAVLDCDEHGSDGTEAFCARLENLWNFSVFGTRFGLRGSVRSRLLQVPRGEDARSGFRTVISQALEEIAKLKPDLLIFQAGFDSHINDPRGTLGLTDSDFSHRDSAVFAYCKANSLPVLVSFAGGYQAADISAAHYVSTLSAAATAYGA